MSAILEKVFEVFGEECPNRSYYSSVEGKPFPALMITKEYKTWAKFELAYKTFVVQKRTEKASKKVVTKKKEVSNGKKL